MLQCHHPHVLYVQDKRDDRMPVGFMRRRYASKIWAEDMCRRKKCMNGVFAWPPFRSAVPRLIPLLLQAALPLMHSATVPSRRRLRHPLFSLLSRRRPRCGLVLTAHPPAGCEDGSHMIWQSPALTPTDADRYPPNKVLFTNSYHSY